MRVWQTTFIKMAGALHAAGHPLPVLDTRIGLVHPSPRHTIAFRVQEQSHHNIAKLVGAQTMHAMAKTT